MTADPFSSGTQVYTLTLRALPGINPQDWVKYRLSIDVDPPDGAYLREPYTPGNEEDQQGYYVYRIDGSAPLKMFLPVVNH
jgi:hypothetical protein